MSEDKNTVKSPQNVILEDRRRLAVSGVSDVDSFDEEVIIIYTNRGGLTIKGSDLHMNALNVETGELTVEGEIDSLIYSDHVKGKGSFLKNLFK